MDLKEYQKDPAFPPDKTSLWADRKKEDDHWVISHNSLRGELDELTTCLTALGDTKPLEAWQLTALKHVWMYHYEHIQKHHESEEVVLQPFVGTRVKYPESISNGHKELELKLNILHNLVTQELPEKAEGGIQPLADLFAPYKMFLEEHLKEEEEVALPLIRAFFTPDEFKETGKAMGQAGGHAGSFVYYVGADKFKNETMAKLGIPFFVWYVAFKGALKEYEESVIKNVTALQEGKPPEAAKGGWLGGLF